jgi:hypothetical protein
VPRHSPLFLVIEAGALGCMAFGLWMLIQLEEVLLATLRSEPTAVDRT